MGPAWHFFAMAICGSRLTTASAAAERVTSVAVAGIARVPLGTYNRADREVGTGVWGASWRPYAWAPDGRTIALHLVDRRHIRPVPFPSYLGDETVASELRRGYPGDENERRSLALVRVDTKTLEPIALDEPGYRGISDFEWSPDGRLLIDQVSDTGSIGGSGRRRRSHDATARVARSP